MVSILSDLFGELQPEEASAVVYLLLGTLGPSYEATQFGMSNKLVIKALALAYQVEESVVIKGFKGSGDLGDVAEILAEKIEGTSNALLAVDVYRMLGSIANTSGNGSIAMKIKISADLFTQIGPQEAKYLCRIILERLRAGFGEATIMDALSWAKAGNKSLRPAIERAFNICPDIGKIAELFLAQGLEGLDQITVTPGIPIRPAQSERLPTPEKIFEKLGMCAVEPKMDGFRAQIHVWGSGAQREAKIFSRNLNETTNMFPEIIASVKALPVGSAIFDAEAIAYNPATDEYLPFQETVKRKRKHGVEEMVTSMPLRAFVFDVLYLNGESLLFVPAHERFERLQQIPFAHTPSLSLIRHTIVSTTDEFRSLFDLYVSEGLEGVMCKKLDAVYQAGARNFNWVKYKRATDQALDDTVDAVVLGYYAGQGQRNRFGIGAFLIGVYDQASGMFQTLAKVGTGLTDEQWKDMKVRLDIVSTEVMPNNYNVHPNLAPDVWTLPQVVVEVAADEITRSPIHTAAKGEDGLAGSGLALRFPRLVRVREDKDSFFTTTPAELLSMHQ